MSEDQEPKQPEEPHTGLPKKQPRTLAEAFQEMAMSEEDAKKLDEENFAAASGRMDEDEKEPVPDAPVEASADAPLPDWVEFPPGFKIPPNKQVVFMYFRAKWTDKPEMGDRWCMMWPLSDSEEKLALKRTRGDSARTLSELAKQTIHLIDGKKADWSNTPTSEAFSVERFWNEIGGKCRGQIINLYVKTHQLDEVEKKDFFEHCVVIRKATGG